MTLKLRREHYVRLYLEVNSVLKNQDAGTKILDDFPRPTCRVYTVSNKRLRHGGSGYETSNIASLIFDDGSLRLNLDLRNVRNLCLVYDN